MSKLIKKLNSALNHPKALLVFALVVLGAVAVSIIKRILGDEGNFWDGIVTATGFWGGLFAFADYYKAKRENAEIAANEAKIDDLEVQIAITRDKLNGEAR